VEQRSRVMTSNELSAVMIGNTSSDFFIFNMQYRRNDSISRNRVRHQHNRTGTGNIGIEQKPSKKLKLDVEQVSKRNNIR
jgi:hypothetical protein